MGNNSYQFTHHEALMAGLNSSGPGPGQNSGNSGSKNWKYGQSTHNGKIPSNCQQKSSTSEQKLLLIDKISTNYTKSIHTHFPRLYLHLPKSVTLWSPGDIRTWLECIGLSTLSPNFESFGVDGSCVYLLDVADVREEIGVESCRSIGMIMGWVMVGFKEYQRYLELRKRGQQFNKQSTIFNTNVQRIQKLQKQILHSSINQKPPKTQSSMPQASNSRTQTKSTNLNPTGSTNSNSLPKSEQQLSIYDKQSNICVEVVTFPFHLVQEFNDIYKENFIALAQVDPSKVYADQDDQYSDDITSNSSKSRSFSNRPSSKKINNSKSYQNFSIHSSSSSYQKNKHRHRNTQKHLKKHIKSNTQILIQKIYNPDRNLHEFWLSVLYVGQHTHPHSYNNNSKSNSSFNNLNVANQNKINDKAKQCMDLYRFSYADSDQQQQQQQFITNNLLLKNNITKRYSALQDNKSDVKTDLQDRQLDLIYQYLNIAPTLNTSINPKYNSTYHSHSPNHKHSHNGRPTNPQQNYKSSSSPVLSIDQYINVYMAMYSVMPIFVTQHPKSDGYRQRIKLNKKMSMNMNMNMKQDDIFYFGIGSINFVCCREQYHQKCRSQYATRQSLRNQNKYILNFTVPQLQQQLQINPHRSPYISRQKPTNPPPTSQSVTNTPEMRIFFICLTTTKSPKRQSSLLSIKQPPYYVPLVQWKPDADTDTDSNFNMQMGTYSKQEEMYGNLYRYGQRFMHKYNVLDRNNTYNDSSDDGYEYDTNHEECKHSYNTYKNSNNSNNRNNNNSNNRSKIKTINKDPPRKHQHYNSITTILTSIIYIHSQSQYYLCSIDPISPLKFYQLSKFILSKIVLKQPQTNKSMNKYKNKKKKKNINNNHTYPSNQLIYITQNSQDDQFPSQEKTLGNRKQHRHSHKKHNQQKQKARRQHQHQHQQTCRSSLYRYGSNRQQYENAQKPNTSAQEQNMSYMNVSTTVWIKVPVIKTCTALLKPDKISLTSENKHLQQTASNSSLQASSIFLIQQIINQSTLITNNCKFRIGNRQFIFTLTINNTININTPHSNPKIGNLRTNTNTNINANLKKNSQNLHLISNPNLNSLCIICCERWNNCIFMNCRHNVACLTCGKLLERCPICRQDIFDYVRIYTS